MIECCNLELVILVLLYNNDVLYQCVLVCMIIHVYLRIKYLLIISLCFFCCMRRAMAQW